MRRGRRRRDKSRRHDTNPKEVWRSGAMIAGGIGLGGVVTFGILWLMSALGA